MKPFMTTKNPKLLDPIRKYWYLCFLYIIFSYLLIRIIVIGSSKIADATDSLFAGEKAALLEFMIPFIILMPWHYLLIQICPLWRLPVNAVMTTAIIFLIHLKKLLVFLR